MFPQKILCMHCFVPPTLCFMLRLSNYFSDGHKNDTTGFSCNGLNQNARMSPQQHRSEINLCRPVQAGRLPESCWYQFGDWGRQVWWQQNTASVTAEETLVTTTVLESSKRWQKLSVGDDDSDRNKHSAGLNKGFFLFQGRYRPVKIQSGENTDRWKYRA